VCNWATQESAGGQQGRRWHLQISVSDGFLEKPGKAGKTAWDCRGKPEIGKGEARAGEAAREVGGLPEPATCSLRLLTPPRWLLGILAPPTGPLRACGRLQRRDCNPRGGHQNPVETRQSLR
jgi:hypothetical protein